MIDAKYKAYTDETMAEQVKQWILSKEYDFILADFDDCDAVGHSNGFDPYLPDYCQAVQKTDVLVGQLLDSLLTVSKDEEWLIILTSDHGGHGTNHGPQDEYNLSIPLLIASNIPRVNTSQISIDDPGSHLDVLPTVIHFFNSVSCVDSSYEFEFEGENRDCTWVAEKNLSIVSLMKFQQCVQIHVEVVIHVKIILNIECTLTMVVHALIHPMNLDWTEKCETVLGLEKKLSIVSLKKQKKCVQLHVEKREKHINGYKKISLDVLLMEC